MDFTLILSTFGTSFVTGFIIGMFLRALTKWIILLLGLELAILITLSNMGVISINWNAMSILIEKTFTTIEGFVTSFGLGTMFFSGLALGYLVKIGKNLEKRKPPRYVK